MVSCSLEIYSIIRGVGWFRWMKVTVKENGTACWNKLEYTMLLYRNGEGENTSDGSDGLMCWVTFFARVLPGKDFCNESSYGTSCLIIG